MSDDLSQNMPIVGHHFTESSSGHMTSKFITDNDFWAMDLVSRKLSSETVDGEC